MNDMTNTPDIANADNGMIDSTVAIVAAYLSGSNIPVPHSDIGDLIRSTYSALSDLGGEPEAIVEEEAPREPAVSVRASVKPDYIVCLEDGKKMKMLKRYLMTHYNMTPEEYRERWNLPADYPMVAPNYSERRRELAKTIGLGKKGRAARKSKSDGGATAKKTTSRAKKEETAEA